MNKNFSEQLYQMLPAIYRKEDANIKPNKEPLRRYLKILGDGGFNTLLKSIEETRFVHDIDNIDSKYLPLIAKTLGLDFPYNIDENTQRKFLKIVPTLYKLKGTESSFNYLAREIFSTKSKITTTVPQYKEGISEEELRKIYLNIEVDGGISDTQRKEEFFRQFAENIRPVNMELLIILKLIYYADYDLQSRARDTVFETLTDHQGVDRFRYRLLVDGVDHNITNSGIILGQNHSEFLHLNQGKTYGGQEIKEVIRLLEDFHILDTILLAPEQEEFNFKGRVTDYFDNFYLNATNLVRMTARLGYNSHRDIITSNEGVDNFRGHIKETYTSAYITIPEDIDVFSKNLTKADSKSSSALNLTKPSTELNKGMKLASNFYLTHFTPLKTNFSY
jgi:phage tail-like protein